MKGWDHCDKEGLSKLKEQLVVGAWHTEEAYDYRKRELIRIISDKGIKQETR